MTPKTHASGIRGIRWLEDVVEGRRARWFARLVRMMVVGFLLAVVGLLVAMHATSLGGPDEVVATLRVDQCIVSVVYRPALVMYGGVFVEVRRLDTTRLLREHVTELDQPGDAARGMRLRQVGSGSVEVYAEGSNDEIGPAVDLPDDCRSPAESAR